MDMERPGSGEGRGERRGEERRGEGRGRGNVKNNQKGTSVLQMMHTQASLPAHISIHK
jgi:hypothetical protein